MPLIRSSDWTQGAITSLKILVALSLVITWVGIILLLRRLEIAALGITLCVWILVSLPVLLLHSGLTTPGSSQLLTVCAAVLAAIVLIIAAGYSVQVLNSNFGAPLQGLLIAAWIIAPVPLAAWLGTKLVRSKGQCFLASGLFLIEVARLWLYGTVNWGDSLAGLSLIFIPVYQYVAIVIMLGIAWIMSCRSVSDGCRRKV